MKDSLQVAKQISSTKTDFNYQPLIEVLDTIKWPLLILIIILIFIRPIKDLISRITKVEHGGTSLEAGQQNTSINNQEIKQVTNVERGLGLFKKETIEMFRDAVYDESDINSFITPEQKVEQLMKYSITLYIIKHFDGLYYLIYGSQIKILQHLNSSYSNKELLKRFFDQAKTDFPKSYENYLYEDYINFLLSVNLITSDDENIHITLLGVDFLKYLTETGKNINKSL